MKTTILAADRLTPAHLEAWSRWQCADGAMDSPFFRPEFTQAVAAVRGDVEAAVLEENDEPVGFFPYQRSFWGCGRPIGSGLSDFQGVIARPGLNWTADDLVRSCGLRTWSFDHLPASQTAFRPFQYGAAESPFLDLSKGFEAYMAQRGRPGAQMPTHEARKARKFGREVGPLRFEFHTTDPSILRALVGWKSAQYRRTGATDIFVFPWILRLLEHVLGESGAAFAGVQSALFAGDRLAAVHLGLRSFGVLHWWFTAYDPEFGPYSPGSILLLELARAAAGRGVQRLDLGKGVADYKTRFMSGAIPLAEGSVTLDPVGRLVRRGWRRTRDWVRSSPLQSAARTAGRLTRPLRGWLKFQ